nr:hypothetical protein [Comamonas jiangduensis]
MMQQKAPSGAFFASDGQVFSQIRVPAKQAIAFCVRQSGLTPSGKPSWGLYKSLLDASQGCSLGGQRDSTNLQETFRMRFAFSPSRRWFAQLGVGALACMTLGTG